MQVSVWVFYGQERVGNLPICAHLPKKKIQSTAREKPYIHLYYIAVAFQFSPSTIFFVPRPLVPQSSCHSGRFEMVGWPKALAAGSQDVRWGPCLVRDGWPKAGLVENLKGGEVKTSAELRHRPQPEKWKQLQPEEGKTHKYLAICSTVWFQNFWPLRLGMKSLKSRHSTIYLYWNIAFGFIIFISSA